MGSVAVLKAQQADETRASVARPGSAELRELVAAIARDADKRERGELSARGAIDLAKAAGLGLFRLPAPEGGGASLKQLFELVIDLAAADSNIPHILRNHFAFVERALRSPNGPTLQRWLGKVRQGEIFGLGATELGLQGVGSGAVDTLLEAEGDGYVLNGRKYYSTGNFYSDVILVNARTPEGVAVNVLVPKDRNGVSVDDDWDGIGQRLTASGTSVFTNVRVSPDEVLFPTETEVRQPFSATFPQLYLTAIVAGILRRVVEDATALVTSRDRNYYHAVAPRPADDPLLQQTIGRLASAAFVAEAAVLRAAEALDAAFASVSSGTADVDLYREASLRAAKAKVAVDEIALKAATELFDVGGASAARQVKALDRHWRNIRTISSHNPAAYKARAIGDHIVNAAPLPNAAFF